MDKDKAKSIEDAAGMLGLAMDRMPVAVTLIDSKGTLLYYNRYAAEILDRKPKYVGTDVHTHHKRKTSNQKLDAMLKEFRSGREEPFRYEAKPYGRVIIVKLSPIRRDGRFLGCVQSVLLKDDAASEE